MNTILLSNLIKIRWIAITGQFLAILLVHFLFEINILIIESLISCIIFSFCKFIFLFSTKKR